MKRIIWKSGLAGICIACSGNISAQIQGDTLQGVEVKSAIPSISVTRSSFQPGAKTIAIDAVTQQLYNQQSIATLLSQVSSVFIKSYGFNSLATLSFRGASSAQSAVYWEGIPLMNAATGITDLSLLPVAFSDSVSLQYGSSGALGGSGNVGGALLLGSQKAKFYDHPKWSGGVQIGFGSFGQVPASAEIGFSSGRFSIRARGVGIKAANDFPANDLYGQAYNTENAAIRGEGVLVDASFKASKRDVITLHAWQQAYNRQIPRALFESGSLKVQDDGAMRFLLDWQHTGKLMQMYTKVAYMQDWFNYHDADIGLNTNVATRHYFGEWGLQGLFNSNTSWLLFAPVQYLQLTGANDTNHQFRSAIAGNLKRSLFDNRLSVAVNGRAELSDDNLIGLPGIGAAFLLTPSFTLRASLQRSYRLPTLNELYYNPGGNRDLKPEKGWSEDAGYSYSHNIASNIVFSHNVSVFNRNIKDWIIWLGGAIWTPHNLAAVHSRGLETENTLTGKKDNIQWHTTVSAAYTRSTPTASYLVNDNSIGNQIPYTPLFTGSALASVNWKAIRVTYVQNYAGKRFITSDESAFIPSYSTGNLFLSYTSPHFRSLISLNASIQNIWNTQYQVIAFRPMPGINYLLSLSLRVQ